MTEKNITLRHTVCIISIFLIGNMLIGFPKGEGQHQGLYGYLICVLYGVLLSLLYLYIEKHKGFNSLKPLCVSNKKIINQVILVLFILFCIVSFCIACRDYVFLVDTVRLPETPKWIITMVFLALVSLLALVKNRVIYMLGLVSFIFTIIAVLFMFITSVDNMSYEILKTSLSFDFGATFKQSLTFFIHSFGQLPIVLLLIGKSKRGNLEKMHLFGILFAGAIFLICLFNVLSVLSAGIIDKINFPYSTVTAITAFGKNSGRHDGFTYYIYFICTAIKSAIILKVAIKLLQPYSQKLKYLVVFCFIFISFFFAVNNTANKVLQSDALNFILWVFEICFPLIFLFSKKDLKHQV